MNRYVQAAARLLVAAVFLLNGFGIIDQSIPARELAEHGAPVALVPVIMWSGRVLEIVAGLALVLGIFPQLAAVALVAFLIPATFVSHAFWQSWGTPAFMLQLINFFKNVAICGGLFFLAATLDQPALLPFAPLRRLFPGSNRFPR